MPTVENPFPLKFVSKVDSPELVAAMRQFGAQHYSDAEDFNEIKQALEWLYQNIGEEGGLTLFDVLKRGGRRIRTDFGTTEEIHDYDLITENRGEIFLYVNANPALKLDRLKLNAGQFDPGDKLEISIGGNAVNDVIVKTDDNTVLFSGANYLPGGEVTLKIGKFYTFLFVGLDGDNEIWIDISVKETVLNLPDVLKQGDRPIFYPVIDPVEYYTFQPADRARLLVINPAPDIVPLFLRNGVFPDGTVLKVINNSGQGVVAAPTNETVVLLKGGVNTGGVLFANGAAAVIRKISTIEGIDTWVVYIEETLPLLEFEQILMNGSVANLGFELKSLVSLARSAFSHDSIRMSDINMYGLFQTFFSANGMVSMDSIGREALVSGNGYIELQSNISGDPASGRFGISADGLKNTYRLRPNVNRTGIETFASEQWCYENLLRPLGGTSVGNIAQRNAYNVPALPFTIFVDDDGDGKWAYYNALSTGVGATFRKLSDEDLFQVELSALGIKAAYESVANAFTNAYKTTLDNLETNYQKKGVYEEYFIFNTTPTTPVTGTTSQTIYYAEKIKAGTLKVGSQFTVEFQPLKTGNAGNSTLNFYVGNSSTDLTFSKIVGSLTRLQTNNNQPFARTYEVVSATKIRLMQWNNSSANDKNQAVSTWEDRDFDISIDQWIIATGTLTSGADTMFGNYMTIKGVK